MSTKFNTDYNLNFDVIHIHCDNFKTKPCEILRNTLDGSRLSVQGYIKFANYGYIFFDEEDNYHQHPKISILEGFHRSKTNCLIYDMKDSNNHFNKLFIYQSTNSKGGGFYGYVMYNENDKSYWHQYYIDREDDALVRKMNVDFIGLEKEDINVRYVA